jgi:hypothetical protein
MSERDLYHDVVRHALEKDGWTITHDPLTLRLGRREMYVDLGAQRRMAAEKGERKIAVEIKSFATGSPVRDLELAVGQLVIYRTVIGQREPDRRLYLAIRDEAYCGIFSEPLGQLAIETNLIPLLVFVAETEEIEQWIEPGNTPASSDA